MENDLIRRSNVIQVFNELLKSPYASNKDSRDALKLARGVFQDDVPKWLSIPAVDAVEVVRCRECMFWNKERVSCEGLARCLTGESGIRYRTKDDYCSRGQRREDGAT